MGQEDVEGFVGKLARMPPGLDGVGQRLRQDVSREDAADDNTGLRRLADGSVLRREHGHVVAARGEPGRRSCGEARRSSLPVGEPLIDGDEDAHGYPPSLPPTRSSRRSVLASHVFCSAVARRRATASGDEAASADSIAATNASGPPPGSRPAPSH